LKFSVFNSAQTALSKDFNLKIYSVFGFNSKFNIALFLYKITLLIFSSTFGVISSKVISFSFALILLFINSSVQASDVSSKKSREKSILILDLKSFSISKKAQVPNSTFKNLSIH